MPDTVATDGDQNVKFNDHFNGRFTSEKVATENCKHLKPSEVLFRLDPIEYEQAVANWKDEDLKKALGKDAFVDALYDQNDRRFKELKTIIRRGRVIPFVGAGLSKSCGYPTWHEYLNGVAGRATNEDKIFRLIKDGDLENAASAILRNMSDSLFDEYSDGIFGKRHELQGAIKLIPKIARSAVITTNFDKAIERCFEESYQSFEDIIQGNSKNEFHRALARGERQLLKLHGSINNVESRVFCKEEYDKAYGVDAFDYSKNLPNTLRRVYQNYCLMFVGCGLEEDRVLKLFESVVEKEGVSTVPRHYAILEAPDNQKDSRELKKRERFLSKIQIFPIWFPKQQYEFVEKILEFLIDEDF